MEAAMANLRVITTTGEDAVLSEAAVESLIGFSDFIWFE
jgi:hypothetical protein